MAYSALTYSTTQWRLAIKGETTAGTANVSTMQLLNIQDIPSWDRGAIRSIPLRSGVGRFKKAGDVNYIEQNQLKTCTVNCLVGATELQMLLENVTGNGVGSSPAGWGFETGYTAGASGAILQGATNTGNRGTLTVALIPPDAGQTELMAGCIVSELAIRGDLTANDTLIECGVTFLSKNMSADSQAIPSSMTAYTAGDNCYRIFDFTGACKVDSQDVIISGFEFVLSNGLGFIGGACNDDGNPSLSRGRSEPKVTGAITMKYDANTKTLPTTSKNQTTAIPVHIADNATWASATAGFLGTSGWIVDNPEISDVEDAAFFTLNLEFLDNGTSDIFEVVA